MNSKMLTLVSFASVFFFFLTSLLTWIAILIQPWTRIPNLNTSIGPLNFPSGEKFKEILNGSLVLIEGKFFSLLNFKIALLREDHKQTDAEQRLLINLSFSIRRCVYLHNETSSVCFNAIFIDVWTSLIAFGTTRPWHVRLLRRRGGRYSYEFISFGIVKFDIIFNLSVFVSNDDLYSRYI
ncbi:hypothetical protein ACOME3_004905 [Neoechinorhynchus agilis]